MNTRPRILSIGQCSFDHGQIQHLLSETVDADVQSAVNAREAKNALAARSFDLVLVNRVFDADGDSGLDFIRDMRRDPTASTTPVMLVSNYTDAQDAAVALGAVRGFGKSALNHPETADLLNKALASRASK